MTTFDKSHSIFIKIFIKFLYFQNIQSVGVLTGVLAAFFNLDQLVHMMSIGTLMAYSIVAACVMLLRYEVADENKKDPNAEPTTNNNSLLHCLWNTDKICVPTELTATIVTIEVTIFCKFVTIRIFSLSLFELLFAIFISISTSFSIFVISISFSHFHFAAHIFLFRCFKYIICIAY